MSDPRSSLTISVVTRAIVLAAALMLACAAPATPASQNGASGQEVEMFWASYQLNAEPHFRLIFEGGSDVVRPSELRLVMPSGATVASAPTVSVPNDTDPLRLCGSTKTSGPRLYGPLRATLAVPEQLFKDFIREPAAFRIEAKISDAWRPTRLTLLCHATE